MEVQKSEVKAALDIHRAVRARSNFLFIGLGTCS
jgi:hypothetical protein